MDEKAKNIMGLVWVQSVLATVGSLYFSEVMKLPPCSLCWYQRIGIYPLVVIMGLGWLREDKRSVDYALPLAIFGLITSIYHNLLYWGILPESGNTCVAGVSCTTRYVTWGGFVTIPLLSLIAFIVSVGALVWLKRKFR